MAAGRGIGDEGSGWQTVAYSRNKSNQNRRALSERPDMKKFRGKKVVDSVH